MSRFDVTHKDNAVQKQGCSQTPKNFRALPLDTTQRWSGREPFNQRDSNRGGGFPIFSSIPHYYFHFKARATHLPHFNVLIASLIHTRSSSFFLFSAIRNTHTSTLGALYATPVTLTLARFSHRPSGPPVYDVRDWGTWHPVALAATGVTIIANAILRRDQEPVAMSNLLPNCSSRLPFWLFISIIDIRTCINILFNKSLKKWSILKIIIKFLLALLIFNDVKWRYNTDLQG